MDLDGTELHRNFLSSQKDDKPDSKKDPKSDDGQVRRSDLNPKPNGSASKAGMVTDEHEED